MTVPVVGFPDGWRLRPGDRVTVGRDPQTGRQAALPLVVRLVGPVQRRDRTTVTVAGTTIALDRATIGSGRAAGSRPGQYEVYYILDEREAAPRAVVFRPLA